MKKISKKMLSVFIILGMLVTTFNILPVIGVFAIEPDNNTKLVVQNNNHSNTIIIDATDTNKLIYKIENTIVGYVKVKLNNNYITPILNNNNLEFDLPKWIENYQVDIEVTNAEGYSHQPSYFYNGRSNFFPGDGDLHLDITSNNIHALDFCFEQANNGGNNGGNNNPGPGPMINYPLLLKFSGINDFISVDSDVIVPEGWNAGDVEFYAKACTNNGHIEPDNGDCLGTQSNLRLDIEGVFDNAGGSVSISGQKDSSNMKAIFSDRFANSGKASFHLVSNESNGAVNQTVLIVTNDYIGIEAAADMNMSFSLGSDKETKATLTGVDEGSVKVFFGNPSVTLIPSGPSISKIKKVTGAVSSTYNNDGSATIVLPSLSKETTTPVTIEFEKSDRTVITKKLNIVRTAITLNYSDADGRRTLYAGYVANKGYLYNNLSHDQGGFDAYLQVILYKDDVVVGYRQVQIDDKNLIDNLEENETNGIESTDFDRAIELVGDGTDIEIGDINKASVFLTNGPINYDSNTLPSIEFGIGSGVQISWEAR